MNWSAIAAIAELLGALAVVFSVLYLAAQVRASARQAKLDASRDLATNVSAVSLAVASEPGLSDLMVAGGADAERLTPSERMRFYGVMNSLFRGLEQQFLLRQEGALEDESWTAVDGMTRDFAATPGAQRYMRDRGHWYAASFRAVFWAHAGTEADGPSVSLKDTYVGDGR